jgi:hypothetical protein
MRKIGSNVMDEGLEMLKGSPQDDEWRLMAILRTAKALIVDEPPIDTHRFGLVPKGLGGKCIISIVHKSILAADVTD